MQCYSMQCSATVADKVDTTLIVSSDRSSCTDDGLLYIYIYISLVLKSAIFENGKYQHFFAGDFAQGSRVRKGDLAKYRSFHENWTPYPL